MKPLVYPMQRSVASWLLLALLASLTGCTTYTYYLKPAVVASLSAQLADYSVKPDHKALYLFAEYNNKYIGLTASAWNQPSTAAAEALAKKDCENALRAEGGSGECHPYAVDNQLTGWDLSPYLHDPWCDNNPCGNQGEQFATLEKLQSILAGANAVAAAKAQQPGAVEHYMQDLTATQQRQQMEANQQAGNAQEVALQQQVAALKAQLQQAQQQQAGAPASPSTTPAPVRSTVSAPAPSSTPNAATLIAHYTDSARYESDGNGGLKYNVYIDNDGQAPLRCTAAVSGLIWGNQFGGSTASDGGLQSHYSDTGTAIVYPGHVEVVGGFGSVVANSGTYAVQCVRYH